MDHAGRREKHPSGGASEELLKVLKLQKRAGETTNMLIFFSTKKVL